MRTLKTMTVLRVLGTLVAREINFESCTAEKWDKDHIIECLMRTTHSKNDKQRIYNILGDMTVAIVKL